jgi:hypothetical protein
MRERGYLKFEFEIAESAVTHSSSYAGLTRVSIILRKDSCEEGWIAASSPAMTPEIVSRSRCGILHAASQNRDPGFFEL